MGHKGEGSNRLGLGAHQLGVGQGEREASGVGAQHAGLDDALGMQGCLLED